MLLRKSDISWLLANGDLLQASARISVPYILPSVQRDVSALRRNDGPQQGSFIE